VLLEHRDRGTQDFLFRSVASRSQQCIHALLYISRNYQGYYLLLSGKTRRNDLAIRIPRNYRNCVLPQAVHELYRLLGPCSNLCKKCGRDSFRRPPCSRIPANGSVLAFFRRGRAGPSADARGRALNVNGSRQQLRDQVRRLGAGEALVQAPMADAEALVVEAEQVQHRGVEVASAAHAGFSGKRQLAHAAEIPNVVRAEC
jgi:hypothetical protein